jgi:V/A-type H+-transporting ATPase subunit K
MTGISLAIIGAALALLGGGFGSMIGTSKTGQVGAGLLTEEPEKFGKILLLQALPSTQGIYGFIAAFWVILKTGMLSGTVPSITYQTGLAILFSCLPIAIGGLLSAIYQMKVCVSGLNIVAKQPDASGKAVTMAAMVETYAILSLLITILLINGIKIT